MDIKANVERVRSLMNTLQNWDAIVEEADRFIFVCTGCGRRLKADKIGTQAKGA